MKPKLAWFIILALAAASSCSRKQASPAAVPKPPEKPSESTAAPTSSESPKEAKTTLITYRSPDGGGLGIIATNFSGVCNITITRGSTKTTSEMPPITFGKLVEAFIPEQPLSGYTLDKKGAGADTETHHIISITETPSDGPAKSKMYAIPDKDAPAEFREWLSLLEKSVRKD